MPEIKQNFIKGRMNKDLDERLIPKGEYRHAMNVEVSTSEDSNVGTVQNIIGNKKQMKHVKNAIEANFTLPPSSKCIGAISDEKNNILYWFITSPTCDGILRTNPDGSGYIQWVFTDPNKIALKFPDRIITGINIIDNLLFWTDGVGEPKKINIDDCVQYTTFGAGMVLQQTKLPLNGIVRAVKEEHITVIKKSPVHSLTLELKTSRKLDQIASGSNLPLSYTARTVISGAGSGLPDGIRNVTTADGNTYDPNDFSSVVLGDKVQIELTVDINSAASFELDWVKDVVGGGGSNANPNNTPWAGQKIVLKEFSDSGDSPGIPLTDYAIKGVLTDYYNVDNPSLISDSTLQNSNDNAGRIIIEFIVTGINGTPETAKQNSTLEYAVDLFDESEKLFEFKFPRFSFRYKYNDNEYSTFAPWSEVAFIPGSFDYHPKKGYNIGMTNRLSSCIVKDFINESTPLDVKEIDILYKEEGSTAIYVVETIKKSATKTINVNLTAYNNWDLNYYEVLDETIHRILPENQFLRPWDNVPTTALAQEVTGSRIVYGN